MKIGAACKWLNSDGTSLSSATFRSTTIKKLTSLATAERSTFLLPILVHNIEALYQQIKLVGQLPKNRRMWRLGSELLPVFTHKIATEFYKDFDVKISLKKDFAKVVFWQENWVSD